MNVIFLRKKYPKFIYRNYDYKTTGGNLKISFLFEVPPDIKFEPEIIIKNVTGSDPVTRTGLDNLVFHLGLIEVPSYWKATCSPEILIKAGYLNKEQIKWWKDLILNGMGQFFYENKINFLAPNFLKIKSNNILLNSTIVELSKISLEKILVPIGGGKDSIVTLEKLKHANAARRINCFSVNPTKAAQEIMRIAGYKNPIIVRREIDPGLLELNRRGYLNGHTPITAVISFLSIFCAILFNYKNIAFSNEKSADEGNVRYLGKIINHQWSKSSEFEKKFRYYCKKYLVKNINYFSCLRKYTELEISKMFTKYPQYFSVFSSCNVVLAKRLKKRWCGNCPKCLFVYATLYPFLKKEQMLKIFGRDFFENPEGVVSRRPYGASRKLVKIMKDLIDPKKPKPFECVGTKKENQLAFWLSLQKAKKEGKIPYLLTRIK